MIRPKQLHASLDRRMPQLRQLSAFTLVELLVVIAIVGVLLAILLPTVQAMRESARRTTCQNNMRQIGVGLASFVSANGKWPPGKKWSGPPTDPNAFALSWSSFLLEHIEQQTLHNAIDFKLPFTHSKNLPATTQLIPTYLCPSTSRVEEHRADDSHLFNLGGMPGEGLGCIDYLGVSGPDKDAKNPVTKLIYGRQRGVLVGTKRDPNEPELIEPPAVTSAKIVDGLSHTLCVTECTGRGVTIQNGVIDALNGAWASGANVSHIDKGVNDTETPKAWYKERIFSDHPGGAHVLMCDSSVQFLTDETDEKVIRCLCSRDGHEEIPAGTF